MQSKVKYKLYEKKNYTCIYCREKFNKKDLTIDHVLPRRFGGTSKKSNIAVSCRDCNQKKGSLLLTQFLRAFEIKVTKEIAEYL